MAGAPAAAGAQVEAGAAAEVSVGEAASAGLAEAVLAVAERAEAGKKRMTFDKDLNQLVERLTRACGDNLVSVVLHGSAASDDFHPEFSDVNTLAVVNELGLSAMQAISSVVVWWTGLKYPPPLFFTSRELHAVADVYAIEMLDIKARHRILHGKDVVQNLEVPMALHRVQLEHEIRTKLLLLRQHYMGSAKDEARIRHLMLDSVSSFLALFRHTLIAMGEAPPHHKRDVAARIAARLGFDPLPLEQLLQVREHTLRAEELNVDQVFTGYVRAIEQVAQAVDAL